MVNARQHLGELLFKCGLIDREQLKLALEMQQSSGLRLGEVLVGLGYVTEADVGRSVAQQLQIPFIPDHELQTDVHVARLIPLAVARRKWILPISERLGRIVLAMADPLDVFTVDEVRFLIGKPVDPVAVTRSALDRLLTQYERVSALRRREGGAEVMPLEVVLPPEADAAPVISLVNELIDRALHEQASDIHLEPGEQEFRVRLRIDGFLREVLSTSMSSHATVIARIKVMAGLDIGERRLPQDGRIELRERNRNVDLRVSTLPTIHGEKAVLRVFDRSRSVPRLRELGLSGEDLRRFQEMIVRPHGMILVTGPTGSGKTTTLLSTIAHLTAPNKNIVTIEDPVEYQLPGINHVQTNAKTGLTFAEGLRAILRQDPNIIMVGEVRDTETADVAVRAALTGHLVFSTLHTNDAPGALTRLIDMGVEPYLVASSVNGVVAQRLVRRLCESCREVAPVHADLLMAYGVQPGPGSTLYRAVGCERCRGSGYSGRFPIFELMAVMPAMQHMIISRRTTAELRQAAQQAGMRSLMANGLERALRGDTTVEEILRVAQEGKHDREVSHVASVRTDAGGPGTAGV